MTGPCAKRRVFCTIVTLDGGHFVGENVCANPQPVCPRAPGEDYAKCRSICQQGDHAELAAMRQAREAGAALLGARAIIEGHYYICEPCGAALRDAGVASVTIRYPVSPAMAKAVDDRRRLAVQREIADQRPEWLDVV